MENKNASALKSSFKTEGFSFEYLESELDATVLWESHCHSQYEMIAVSEGRISIMIEGRSYSLRANEVAIIPPLYYHTLTADKKGVYKRVTVLFDRASIPEVLWEHFEAQGLAELIFSSNQVSELRRVCCSDKTALYAPLAESLMIGMMYERIDSGASDNETEVDELLNRIISYIDEHLCERLCLDDIAAHTARSKSSVCHLFREKMRISPKQYVLQKRLALAEKLIRDGTPPTVAAIQVGYENYSDFYRMYTKHIRRAPSNDKAR